MGSILVGDMMRLDMIFQKSRAYLFARGEQISWHNGCWASGLKENKPRSECFSTSQQDMMVYGKIFNKWF
jgi:hypothetical protein